MALWGAQEAHAAASDWWRHDHGELRLIASSDAAGRAGTLRVGLHFRMRPGWKIYWRSPGDAGFPPRLNWAESENLADATLRWPAPKRFKVLGLQTVGYKDEVVFPIDVTVFEPGKPVKLRSKIVFLTCSDVCVPHETDLALTLPPGPETTSREAGLIQAYNARVPGRDGDLRIDRAEVKITDSRAILRVAVAASSPLVAPDIFVESSSDMFFGPPRFSRLGDGREALLTVPVKATVKDFPTLSRLPVTLTVVDGDRAVERKVTLVPAKETVSAAAPASVTIAAFIGILGLAFLGGLILNLMPCVLPVLSIKLLSVVGHGGGDRSAVRAGFLASAAGIVTSFLVLATGAVTLRAAGLAAGWGIQFQQPIFLAAMIVILTLFACNMWGFFEFRLPGAVSDAALRAGESNSHGGAAGGGRGDSAGGGHSSSHSLLGHFMVGAFAALLATPCSAPFLGTAVGFALSQGPAEIYAVFVALGLGLGAPYLTVAAAPGLATRLPRPGHWMVTLRRVLGLALAATAIWLVTVLAAQIGYPLAGMVAILMVAVAVALWPIRNLPGRARTASWIVIAALCVIAVLTSSNQSDAPKTVLAKADYWRPFDRAVIAEEVRRGRVVMVDVTADWCLTCKVNKGLVLDRDPVRSRLEAPGVLAMQADWTRSSPEITEYLKSHGRYGIPFNIVYGPGTPGGEPLAEILTSNAVMGALDRASRGVVKARASRGAVTSAAK